MILLSLAMIAVPSTMAVPPTTYVSVINPVTGDGNFKYNTTSPPPGNVFTVNITVTDVNNLGGWQVNLTWDPTLLSIAAAADVFLPPDHILNGFDPTGAPAAIDNALGNVMMARAVGAASPYVSFNGSGRMMCVKFTVIKIPTLAQPFLSCNLTLDLVSLFPTSLIDPDAMDIAFTPENGYYEYSYVTPPPSMPWLEVSPLLKVVGEPLGPPIVGHSQAFFTVDIWVKNLTTENDVIGIQNAAIYYNNTLLRLNNLADPTANVSVGIFMNTTLWAPYGITFIWVQDIDWTPGVNRICIGCIINPNDTTSEYDWPERPFGDGLFCTLHFEVLYQEAFPWEQTTPLDLAPLFPNEMFLNTTLDWIPYTEPVDGAIKIKGYIVGRMIDLYMGVCTETGPCVPYPYPFGGQGLNVSADTVWAQKLVCLWANVTYNFWPVQHKVVTFEILDKNGQTLTVISNFTDANGVAFVEFRMPWPCDNPESLFGIWHIIASVDVACVIVKDHLWFHYDYLATWAKVTVDPAQIGHSQTLTIEVIVKSYAWLPHDVLVTVDLKDELQVPIGFQALWLHIGDRNEDWTTKWCTYKNYTLTFHILIPKYAFAGLAHADINILSDLPSKGGAAYCPEYIAEFVILAT
jgi:hypothetical protein